MEETGTTLAKEEADGSTNPRAAPGSYRRRASAFAGDGAGHQRAGRCAATRGGAAGGPGGAVVRNGDRPGGGAQKGLIEPAYAGAEAAGVAVWCQDEAGPYQTAPVAGQSWEPMGKARGQPPEDERNGTAKRLTLFHPASGRVRAKGVTSATTPVLHPGLQTELKQGLADLPAVTTPAAERPPLAQWQTWEEWPSPHRSPLRLIPGWDNLAGHPTPQLGIWRYPHGGLPRYTPF